MISWVGKFNPTVDSDLLKVRLMVVRMTKILGNSSSLFARYCSIALESLTHLILTALEIRKL